MRRIILFVFFCFIYPGNVFCFFFNNYLILLLIIYSVHKISLSNDFLSFAFNINSASLRGSMIISGFVLMFRPLSSMAFFICLSSYSITALELRNQTLFNPQRYIVLVRFLGSGDLFVSLNSHQFYSPLIRLSV